MIKGLIVLLATVALTACSSGGGGGGGTGFGANIQSQFVDAPVKGLSFQGSSTATGKTGDNGKFVCKRGELVTFSLKNKALGQAACGEKIFIQDLSSTEAGYTWQKAAALIQSFSTTTAAGTLDLSSINASSTSVAINFNSGTFESDIQGAVTAANITGLTAVSLATAAGHANNSLVEYINLSDEFKAFLAAMVADSTVIKITGKLTAGTKIGGEEFCWTNMKATASVKSESSAYTFNIDSAIGYNNEQSVTDFACAGGEAACETMNPSHLPKKKFISGTNMDLIFFNTITDPSYGQVESRNALSLTAKQVGENVLLTGVYENNLKALEGEHAGTVVNCKYSLASVE